MSNNEPLFIPANNSAILAKTMKAANPRAFTKDDLDNIYAALAKRRSTVRFRGREFSLRYTDQSVYVAPVRGYTPCGWIARTRPPQD